MSADQATTRRSFLRFIGVGAGATLLAACGQAATTPPPAATSAPAAKPTTAPAAAAPTAAPAAKPTTAPAAAAATTAPAAGAAAKPTAAAAAASDFDWMKYKGSTVRMILNKHPFTEALIPLLPQFEAQTGIKTTNLILPEAEYFQKILVDLSTGGGEYDVFMTGPYAHWAYDSAGWTQPLEDYLQDPKMTASDYDAADLFPPLMAANRWDLTLGGGVGKGHQWAIPVMVETYVQVYRKDIYDAAGLKPATTIEEWRDNNKKATSGDVKGIIVRGSRGGGMTGTGFISTFRGYGGKVFDDNLVCTINSAEGIHIAEEYCASVKESGPEGWTNVTWYEGQEGYASGQYAQYFDCDFFTALYEDPTKSKVAGKNAVALPPHAVGMDPFSSVWTWALGMSARSQDKNASWYFIQWATAKAQMIKATVDGQNYNPTRKSVFDSADVQKSMKSWGNGTYLPAVLDNLGKYASPGWPPEPEQTFVGTRWDQALQEIWSGTSGKEALDGAKADIDAHMKDVGLLK
jgi:multiple sugar transport system substrate-binding protein